MLAERGFGVCEQCEEGAVLLSRNPGGMRESAAERQKLLKLPREAARSSLAKPTAGF